MNKLLKDAIADAKAVRETALANAKVALEEAFAPKLQSMLSHKIKEEMEQEEEEEPVASEEEQMEVSRMQKNAGIMSEEDFEDGEEMDTEEAPEEDYESEEDFGSEEEAPAEEAPEEDQEVSDEELEEILRELEGEDEEGMEAEEEGMNYESEDPDKMEMEMTKGGDEEEVDLDEIINALKEEDEAEEETKEDDTKEAELEEAYNVIKFLRSKLNEVNLLNAKLLFVNKLFRKGELTETQKVKIIETFDRAKNVREAKLIYATLSESVNSKVSKSTNLKKKMNEGFASAPQKKTQIISESNDVYSRFKHLVNYNNK